MLDDSPICLVNCHLAAGQTQTMSRNADITAILESKILPAERKTTLSSGIFTGGGDGSMILDHEICIFYGDFNYRIDTMSRDTIIKAITTNNLPKLLERDQLLVSRRRNPTFGMRCLKELPINFAPTYKYDLGYDRYDTSEKRRSPAWCDRILYRGAGTIDQMTYETYELRASDHRPVIGEFRLRIKSIVPGKQAYTKSLCERRLEVERQRLTRIIKYERLWPNLHVLLMANRVNYLRDVFGIAIEEAQELV